MLRGVVCGEGGLTSCPGNPAAAGRPLWAGGGGAKAGADICMGEGNLTISRGRGQQWCLSPWDVASRLRGGQGGGGQGGGLGY